MTERRLSAGGGWDRVSPPKPLGVIGSQADDIPPLLDILGLEAHALECCATVGSHVLTDNPVSGPVVFVYRDGAAALAASMRDQTDPSAALATWCRCSRAFIALLRRNRRRALVVELEAVKRDPDTFRALLAGHMSAALPDPSVATQTAADPDPVLEMLARVSFAQDATAQRINAELEASLALPPLPATRPDVDAIFAAWAAHAPAEDTAIDPDALYLAKLQAEQATRELRRQRAAYAQLRAQRDALQNSLTQHDDARRAAETLPAPRGADDTATAQRRLRWYERELGALLGAQTGQAPGSEI